jgi:hypothetical protein
MNKKIRITVCAICALLMCLTVTTALAGTVYATATVDYGSTSTSTSGSQILNENVLKGTIKSTYATGTNDQDLYGEMWTKGSVWKVKRDTGHVNPYGSTTLYWGNPSSETGTFFAKAYASSGNHDGYCKVSQSGH